MVRFDIISAGIVVFLSTIFHSSECWSFDHLSPSSPGKSIPDPDGQLHIYALPVGQGDAHVIQCPTGTLTVVDLGSSDSNPSAGFWHITELRGFFEGNYNRIRNIMLSHNHYDHYSFLNSVLTNTDGMTSLQNIYVSCSIPDLHVNVSNWVTSIGGEDKLRLFNAGQPCGANGIPCGTLDLCPATPGVVGTVLSANVGQQCNTGGNKNPDSIVFTITYDQVTIQMNGDFEDFTNSATENGPLRKFTDFYGDSLQVTIYKVSHHGAETYANKAFLRSKLRPKAAFVSANSFYGANYRHPRCSIFDDFSEGSVSSLCKPLETDPDSEFYCGEHPVAGISADETLQRVFTCGNSTTLRTVRDNDYAIYSTVPDANTLNVVELRTDGVKWGFINNFLPRVGKMGAEIPDDG